MRWEMSRAIVRTTGLVVLAGLAVGAGCQPSQPVKQGEPRLPRAVPTTAPEAEDGPSHLEMPDEEDVLAKALELNSTQYAAPPREWRQGHVSKAKLAPSALKRGKGRFEVRLPSGAPIATPTVYRNKVMVSGGFRSKQFYALKVETGEPVWGLQLDDDGPSTAACAERRGRGGLRATRSG